MLSSVFITGANRGLGLEFTRQYLEAEKIVYATCRSIENANSLQGLKEKYPNTLNIFPLDVSNMQSILTLKSAIGDTTLDLVVNNAGITGPTGVFDKDTCLNEETASQWLYTFHINSISPMMISLALQPNLEKSKAGIVAIVSSRMGSISENNEGFHFAYRSSKTAVNSAAKSLSIAFASKNIKVLLLHPGWVRTDMGGPQADISPETSVSGMRSVIEKYPDSSREFQMLDYNGKVIPW